MCINAIPFISPWLQKIGLLAPSLSEDNRGITCDKECNDESCGTKTAAGPLRSSSENTNQTEVSEEPIDAKKNL